MPLVELKSISKLYGEVPVLKKVSLSVEAQEKVVLIGRSGSGKSTLLRCINGLEGVQDGDVLVDGVRVNDPNCDLRKIRQSVGIVFQSYNLFPHLSVGENIALAPRLVTGKSRAEARDLAAESLRLVGLVDKIDSFPQQLSGGQQQRVAIARSLAMRPKVMLFDEVTSALDPELTAEVLKVLEELAAGGMTMVLVTHEMGFARRIGSRVVFMHDGQIWEEGSADQALTNPATPELQSFLKAVLH